MKTHLLKIIFSITCITPAFAFASYREALLERIAPKMDLSSLENVDTLEQTAYNYYHSDEPDVDSFQFKLGDLVFSLIKDTAEAPYLSRFLIECSTPAEAQKCGWRVTFDDAEDRRRQEEEERRRKEEEERLRQEILRLRLELERERAKKA